MPHVEVTDATSRTSSYETAGPAFQGFAGINFDLVKYVSIFTEYKLTYSDMDVGIPGGSVQVDPWSHHVVVGLTLHLERPHSHAHPY